MSTTASINISGSVNQMSPNCQQQNQHIVYQDGGQQDQSGMRGPVYHVAGSQPGQVTDETVRQVFAPAPKPAYSASNYPQNAQPQQQQYQQQSEMGSQYLPPQQQYHIQQQFQSPPQPIQQQQNQYPQQQSPQAMYQQEQYLPYEQYQQQYSQPPEAQYQPIQMVNVQSQMSMPSNDSAKPPVFEAPISKIQIVKKNQTAPPKAPTPSMQQSFRSSRSGSFSALDEITDPPQFVKHPEPHQATSEGDPVCMYARVTPAADPNLTVQWHKDGQPLSAGSRFNTSFERGFAVIEILYTVKDDSGEYSCVAKNNFGMDQTSPSTLNVIVEDYGSNLSQEMTDNIASSEDNFSGQQGQADRYEIALQQPKFLRPMHGLYNLYESQSVHLETIFVPINDSALVIEWYKNGKPLNNGCRFNMISDRGFAILDIIGLIADDAGDYFCMASNAVGKAQSNIVRLVVTADATVVTTSQLPKESIQHLQALDSCALDDAERPEFRYEENEEVDSPPHFDIEPVDVSVEEGNPAKFLVKVSGYPRPRIQWFMNDSLEVSTSNQRIFNDGSISYFEFHKCRQIGDSYLQVIAKNKNGEARANATLTVVPVNDFRPELKRVDPAVTAYNENPFRKLTSLKKVEVSSELKNAFTKQKPMPIELNNIEKGSIVRGKQTGSNESTTAENLYNNVQSRLRRSDRLNYSGAPTSNVAHQQVSTTQYPPVQPVDDVPSTSNQPAIISSQMTFSFGK